MPRKQVTKSASKSSRTPTAVAAKPASKPAATPSKPTATVESKPVSKGKVPDLSTYANALRWLHERTDIERSRNVRYSDGAFSLDRMHQLLKLLGNPHEQVKTVHVAGTVGKGSTVAMIASMLRACGYVVAEYISPHLVDVRERLTVNGKMILP